GNTEVVGDLLVRLAGKDTTKNLLLAVRERPGRCSGRIMEPLEQFELRRFGVAAVCHDGANALNQKLGTLLFEKDPGAALLQQLGRLQFADSGGDHQHFTDIALIPSFIQESSALLQTQIDVQQDQIDGIGPDDRDTFIYGGAFADNLKVWFG